MRSVSVEASGTATYNAPPRFITRPISRSVASISTKCSRLWLLTIASNASARNGMRAASALTYRPAPRIAGISKSSRTTARRSRLVLKLPVLAPKSSTRAPGGRDSNNLCMSECVQHNSNYRWFHRVHYILGINMPATRFIRPATALLAFATAFAQNLAPPQAADQNVIRINVNLVQVDAVVTDSHDHLVPNLEATDFQVLQDGKPQKITNFSYINVRPPNTAPAPVTVAEKKGVPPPPPVMIKPEQARRLIALVVDDLALAFDSTARVRGALKKFVDNDMQPGDLVAIIRTGAGMGSLQQFTADKRVLYAAIEHVRWNSMGRVGIGSFQSGGGAYDAHFTDAMTSGSLNAIQYVVSGLHDLPGRKAVILFSENLKLFSRNGDNDLALLQARRLEDAANRSGVVIYTIDPRGLQTTSLTAADNTGKMSRKQIDNFPMMRSAQIIRSQDGMVMLANDTGGLFFHDSNDIAGQLRRAVADTEGYYLLGYHPDASTFDPKTGLPKFHKVEVKLTRSGMHVRSRSGFFGKSDSYAEHKPVGRQAELAAALQSPFGDNQIHVRLTTLFAQSPAVGSFVDAMLHVDAKDLKFTDQPDGWHKAVIDVAAVTFGEDGQPVDSSSKTFTLQFKDAAYQNALQNGLVYTMQHLVKK